MSLWVERDDRYQRNSHWSWENTDNAGDDESANIIHSGIQYLSNVPYCYIPVVKW